MALFNNTREKTIKGKKVTIFLLPAIKGLVMAKKLSQLFLPTVSGLAESSDPESGINLSEVATLLVDSLDNLDLEEVVSQLLNHMMIDGQEIVFDEYFMGNYGELISIITFALEANFSSFFGGKDLASLLKDKLPQMQATAE